MPEKLFIIMEVVEVDEGKVKDGINHHYKPIDAKFDGFCDEELWLQPERVIPASRLRHDVPKAGDTFFHKDRGWSVSGHDFREDHERLILSPPAPVDEWEAWVEEMPEAVPDYRERGRLMREWFRRMPRRDK